MIKPDFTVHKRKLYMDDSHIDRKGKEEHFKRCVFVNIDFTKFDFEGVSFYECLFSNCLLTYIQAERMHKCTIIGSYPDAEREK